MNFFFALPEGLLTDILSDWLSAAIVCRLDSACCNHKSRPALLRALGQAYISKAGAYINEKMFRWMLLREVQFHEIIYGSIQAKKFGDNALELALATTCQSVTTFTFRKEKGDAQPRFEPTQRSFRTVAKYCPDLRIFSCYSTRAPTSMIEMLSECKELREVTLVSVSGLPASIFEACFGAPHLQSLAVAKCTFLEEITPVGTSATLRSLSITDTGLSARQGLQLCEHCPNLTNLSIEIYQGFLEAVELAKCCPLLQSCVVADPRFLYVPQVETLCENWTSLTELTLFCKNKELGHVCSKEALLVLIRQCPTLQYLRLVDTPLPRSLDRSRSSIVSTHPAGSQLRELVVGSLPAALLEVILTTCVNLHTLHVIHLRRSYSDYGIAFIEDSLDLLHASSVRKLILEDTEEFSSEPLLKIAHLEELELQCVSGDFHVDDLIETLTQCPDLHTLVLSFPPPDQITRCDIRSILDAAPKLRSFVYADREESDSFPSMEALRAIMPIAYPHIKDSQFTSVRNQYR